MAAERVVMGHTYTCQHCGVMAAYWTWIEGEEMRCVRCGRWQKPMSAYTAFPSGWCEMHKRHIEDCGCLRGG